MDCRTDNSKVLAERGCWEEGRSLYRARFPLDLVVTIVPSVFQPWDLETASVRILFVPLLLLPLCEFYPPLRAVRRARTKTRIVMRSNQCNIPSEHQMSDSDETSVKRLNCQEQKMLGHCISMYDSKKQTCRNTNPHHTLRNLIPLAPRFRITPWPGTASAVSADADEVAPFLHGVDR